MRNECENILFWDDMLFVFVFLCVCVWLCGIPTPLFFVLLSFNLTLWSESHGEREQPCPPSGWVWLRKELKKKITTAYLFCYIKRKNGKKHGMHTQRTGNRLNDRRGHSDVRRRSFISKNLGRNESEKNGKITWVPFLCFASASSKSLHGFRSLFSWPNDILAVSTFALLRTNS